MSTMEHLEHPALVATACSETIWYTHSCSATALQMHTAAVPL